MSDDEAEGALFFGKRQQGIADRFAKVPHLRQEAGRGKPGLHRYHRAFSWLLLLLDRHRFVPWPC